MSSHDDEAALASELVDELGDKDNDDDDDDDDEALAGALRDSFELASLATFDAQAAGKGTEAARDAILSDGRRLFKPAQPNERAFYERMRRELLLDANGEPAAAAADGCNVDVDDVANSPSSKRRLQALAVARELMTQWAPRFYGVRALPTSAGDERSFLVLENACAGFARACALDLKLGSRGYSDAAPFHKKMKQRILVNVTPSARLGFRVCGLRAWHGRDASAQPLVRDKLYGAVQLPAERAIDALVDFVLDRRVEATKRRRPRVRFAVAQALLAQLERLCEFFELRQTRFRFYDSSLLCVYDGASELDEELAASARLLFIDFNHVDDSHEEQQGAEEALDERNARDDSTLHGLTTIRELLRTLVSQASIAALQLDEPFEGLETPHTFRRIHARDPSDSSENASTLLSANSLCGLCSVCFRFALFQDRPCRCLVCGLVAHLDCVPAVALSCLKTSASVQQQQQQQQAPPHELEPCNFTLPAACDACSRLLHGVPLRFAGERCARCGLTAHAECREAALALVACSRTPQVILVEAPSSFPGTPLHADDAAQLAEARALAASESASALRRRALRLAAKRPCVVSRLVHVFRPHTKIGHLTDACKLCERSLFFLNTRGLAGEPLAASLRGDAPPPPPPPLDEDNGDDGIDGEASATHSSSSGGADQGDDEEVVLEASEQLKPSAASVLECVKCRVRIHGGCATHFGATCVR